MKKETYGTSEMMKVLPDMKAKNKRRLKELKAMKQPNVLCLWNVKKAPEESGIYMIHSRYHNEVYIGSTFNFRDRMRKHYSKLCRGNHPNLNLQMLFNANQVLFFKVIRKCDLAALPRVEQEHIDRYENRLLNLSKTAARHRSKNR